MLEYFVYLIYRAGFALVGLLPLRAAFALGDGLGFCAWIVLGKYRRLGFRNIEIAFGTEKSPREMRRLARRHFQRLFHEDENLITARCGYIFGLGA